MNSTEDVMGNAENKIANPSQNWRECHYFSHNAKTATASCACGWKKLGVRTAAQLRKYGYQHLDEAREAAGRTK
jgi:hypothetical protein